MPVCCFTREIGINELFYEILRDINYREKWLIRSFSDPQASGRKKSRLPIAVALWYSGSAITSWSISKIISFPKFLFSEDLRLEIWMSSTVKGRQTSVPLLLTRTLLLLFHGGGRESFKLWHSKVESQIMAGSDWNHFLFFQPNIFTNIPRKPVGTSGENRGILCLTGKPLFGTSRGIHIPNYKSRVFSHLVRKCWNGIQTVNSACLCRIPPDG